MSTFGDLPRVPHAPRGSGPDPVESSQALRHLQNLSVTRRAAGHRPLTEEEQAELAEEKPCIHCGGFHARSCPRVKRIAFHPNGQIAEAEYWPDAEVSWSGVVFEDVGGGDADEDLWADLEELLDFIARPEVFNYAPPTMNPPIARLRARLGGTEP